MKDLSNIKYSRVELTEITKFISFLIFCFKTNQINSSYPNRSPVIDMERA